VLYIPGINDVFAGDGVAVGVTVSINVGSIKAAWVSVWFGGMDDCGSYWQGFCAGWWDYE
jgi:hypothetical protein